MPLTLPNLSDLNYQELLNRALARIPVHNPEWTNFNDSDPGVTIIQLSAFLIENLLYRSNQIPERNRLKFLRLLGIQLQPATPAAGLITINNERGRLETVTLGGNLEVRAGQVSFRSAVGLDVLPVESLMVIKQAVTAPDAVRSVYEELYMTYANNGVQPTFSYYQSVNLDDAARQGGVNILADTVDGALWIALLRRASDPSNDEVRDKIAGRVLNIGMVPALSEADLTRILSFIQPASQTAANLLRFEIPVGGSLGPVGQRVAKYRVLDSVLDGDVFTEPTIAQVTLPGTGAELQMWTDIDPLEMGVGDLPPNLEDTNLSDRLLTWLRVRMVQPGAAAGSSTAVGSPATTGAQGRFSLLWAGINTARITQRNHVSDELLPQGTGGPDQVVTLANQPVVPGSVTLTVTTDSGSEEWQPIDDLLAAGPEVYVPDPRWPPGVTPSTQNLPPAKVYSLDAESGEIHFGDGQRGARPPLRAVLRASYDSCQGQSGNVGANAIDSGPTLPAGFKVTNPVATWGGAEAESVQDGEKQITRYLQHRDRLVTAEDFQTIAERTPGVDIGRVEVIPAYNPALKQNEPGDAPGVVTLMAIPKYDRLQPDAPLPDRLFLNTICNYLDARRLVTTEVILKGPQYQGIWVSVSIRTVPGASIADVTARVKTAIQDFLSPLPVAGFTTSFNPDGWPMRTPVIRMQLLAVASRVDGVLLVNGLYLAKDDTTLTNIDSVDMQGLQLPRLLGIVVTTGPITELNDLRDQVNGGGTPGTGSTASLPVPVIPEMCQ